MTLPLKLNYDRFSFDLHLCNGVISVKSFFSPTNDDQVAVYKFEGEGDRNGNDTIALTIMMII